MDKVFCDKCKDEFTPELLRDVIRRKTGRFDRYYFVCPHCSEEYTAYCHNAKTHNLIERMRKIEAEMKERDDDALMEQRDKLRERCKYIMDDLKAKV